MPCYKGVQLEGPTNPLQHLNAAPLDKLYVIRLTGYLEVFADHR